MSFIQLLSFVDRNPPAYLHNQLVWYLIW